MRVIFLLECDSCFELSERVATCATDDTYTWANTACDALYDGKTAGWLIPPDANTHICPLCLADNRSPP
jgi:hypothetical protein